MKHLELKIEVSTTGLMLPRSELWLNFKEAQKSCLVKRKLIAANVRTGGLLFAVLRHDWKHFSHR